MTAKAKYAVGIDIGGTFTDLVASEPATGRTITSKVLNKGRGPGDDLRDALNAAGVSSEAVADLTHGTTVVTNLLIERQGATVGLITTRGFRDVLEIQLSYRERSIDLAYTKTPPTVPRRLRQEIGGRIDSSGRELEPLDKHEIVTVVNYLLSQSVEVIVVALFNSYMNSSHELTVAKMIPEVDGDVAVVVSSAVDRRMGEFERTSTAVLNGMAVPRMERYVDDLAAKVSSGIHYMHSAAGVIPAQEARVRPIQLALSGPAAGVLAARSVAQQLGYENAITMDMGGTSCDVSLIWDGEFRYHNEFELEWGVPARVHSLDVLTIGAGGGSICHIDSGGAFRVGPLSAGASPGPACYARGGENATVTDANLVLGVISPSGLLGGTFPLDITAGRDALQRVGDGLGVSPEEAAEGAFAIVNANMAQAIREVTVKRGLDPRECVLIAFGGAGAQHAAAVAAELDIVNVIIPANASVLSAVGLVSADTKVTSAQALLVPLEEVASERVTRVFAELAHEADERLDADQPVPGAVVEKFLGLRYVGQSHEVAVAFDLDASVVAERFEENHERLYGTRLGDPIEIVDCWLTVTVARAASVAAWHDDVGGVVRQGITRRKLVLVDDEVDVYDRTDLPDEVIGPCLIEEAQSITYVPARVKASLSSRHLVLSLPRTGRVNEVQL